MGSFGVIQLGKVIGAPLGPFVESSDSLNSKFHIVRPLTGASDASPPRRQEYVERVDSKD